MRNYRRRQKKRRKTNSFLCTKGRYNIFTYLLSSRFEQEEASSAIVVRNDFFEFFESFGDTKKNKNQKERKKKEIQHNTTRDTQKKFPHVNVSLCKGLSRDIQPHGGVLCPHHQRGCVAHPRSTKHRPNQRHETEPEGNVHANPCKETTGGEGST